MTRAEKNEDDEEVRLALSAASGIRMTADTGTKPKLGDTVNITIQPDAGYQVGTVTMTIEDKSVSAEPDENVIRINGRAYYLSSNLDGSRVLTIRNIGQSMKVKAESVKGSVQLPENTGSILPQYTILTNGDVGVTVTPSGTNVPQGSEVSFRIVPQSGYAIQSITLRVGTESKTFQPNVTQVSLGGRTYGLRQNGREVVLFVTGVTSPVSVSASSRQAAGAASPVTPQPTQPQKPTQSQKPVQQPTVQKPQTSKPVTKACCTSAGEDGFFKIPPAKKSIFAGKRQWYDYTRGCHYTCRSICNFGSLDSLSGHQQGAAQL